MSRLDLSTTNMQTATTMVSGIDKLCQNFIIELLTEKGSVHYLPARGCSFLPRLRKKCRTEYDVMAAFNAVKYTIRNQLRAYDNERPTTERLSNVSIREITISRGEIVIEFLIRNKARQVVNVFTPPIKVGVHNA